MSTLTVLWDLLKLTLQALVPMVKCRSATGRTLTAAASGLVMDILTAVYVANCGLMVGSLSHYTLGVLLWRMTALARTLAHLILNQQRESASNQ